jgi:serine/threonine protein kinase
MRFCTDCKTTYPPDILLCPKDGCETGERKEIDRFIGKFAGSYRIVELLGEGGMGYVYRAEHATLHKKVAIKLIHPELAKRKDLVDRFLAEAKTISLLENENIVDIHDFGLLDGEIPFFVMEFLEGETLCQLLSREKKLPEPEAIRLMTQLLEALGTAHKNHIVHRDIKPANVFLVQKKGQAVVKLLDFGIAKFLDPNQDQQSTTKTGNFMGTPQYMSPEQIQGRSAEIDARSDLYSVGVLLYECVCGELPFEGTSFGDFVIAHVMTPAPLASSKHPEVSRSLSLALQKALQKKREDRFQSAQEMISALSNPAVEAAPAPLVSTPAKTTPKWIYGAAASLILVTAAMTSSLFFQEKIAQPTPEAIEPEIKPSTLATSIPASQPETPTSIAAPIEPKPKETPAPNHKTKERPKPPKEKKETPKETKPKDPGNGTIPFGGGR